MYNTKMLKSWGLQDLSQNERYMLTIGEQAVIKETEKAVLIMVVNKYGTMKKWFPKSAFGTEQENKPTWKEKYQQEFNKYKEAGVKGIRNKMKLETIRQMAVEQGITC